MKSTRQRSSRSARTLSEPVSALTRPRSKPARGLQNQVVPRLVSELRPFPGNARHHPEAQIASLMKNIKRVWTNPILIDEDGTILAGHGRWVAAQRLGMTEVPTIVVGGLNDHEKRAIVIADNRIAEQAEWDFDVLRLELQKLIDIDFDVELTGFSTGEIDLLIDSHAAKAEAADPADAVDEPSTDQVAVSQPGDLWHLGKHLLACGDALESASYLALLRDDLAQMVVTDPPYNLAIKRIIGRGNIRHREFVMGSDESSSGQFRNFLARAFRQLVDFSEGGSIHFVFIDWRHVHDLIEAALPLYSEYKNLLIWNKTNPGLGTFYRSKHELIAVFKNGARPHINNFAMGAVRYRTNVLDYPSVNSLHPARAGDLELHPTVKPVALIADLIRDCSRRNGIILDPFGGSGTTILAAERTGRIARVMELDPLYVDTAIRRWEKVIGIPARHASGATFEEIATKRTKAIRVRPVGRQGPKEQGLL